MHHLPGSCLGDVAHSLSRHRAFALPRCPGVSWRIQQGRKATDYLFGCEPCPRPIGLASAHWSAVWLVPCV